MGANILVYISLSLSVVALILGIYMIASSGQMRAIQKLFGGKTTGTMAEAMDQVVEKLNELDTHATQTSQALHSIIDQLNTATQHVGVIRYNSNGDDGGNLSFSAAFLDAHQSGIVLTSLHGRQNNRIYAKVITTGTSESTLSEEEREAVITALTPKQNADESANKKIKQKLKS